MQSLQSQLADLLFGATTTVNTVATAINATNGWHELLELSFKRRVTPQLWQRLQLLEQPLVPEVRQEFGRLCRVIAIQSTTAAHRSIKVMQALAAANINAVAFKGIGVMASLYPKPSDRIVGDVDILIEPETLPAVFEVLQPLGFTPVLPGELNDYLEYLEHRTRADNLFLIFKDTSGFEVDLHWGLKAIAGVEFPVSEILERGETVTLLQQSLRVAGPIDAMLLAVHHSVRDDLTPASALKDLCDLRAWWHCRDRWQPDAVVSQASKAGLLPPLLALWQVLADYDATQSIQAELTQIKTNLPSDIVEQANSLQTLFNLQLQGENLNRDLVNSLSWSTVVRFIRRRLQKGNTLTFDQSLWGIRHNSKFNLNKIRKLFQTLRGLDRKKLDAYKALSNLQDR